MAVNVAINGFGRIGRMVLRSLVESSRSDINVIAINDLGSLPTNAHLFRYDSTHGRLNRPVSIDKSTIDAGMGPIQVFAEPNPDNLPWRALEIDVVMECSGHFTDRPAAARHLTAGAKRVLVSSPSKGADITVVFGVNHHQIKEEHLVISNGSCTTNCLAPVASVLHRHIGIEMGYMTTIHAYTGDQRIIDTHHSDLHRARAAAQSMIPTSTGAAKALGLVIPELAGRLDGTAMRVPTANVSVVDLTFTSSRDTSAEEINQFIKDAAATGPLKGVLATNDEPLVSIDFNHHPASSIFDLTQTQVVQGRFVRVLAWYDNEWGFSNRMNDVAALL